jgi:hypothetical protein
MTRQRLVAAIAALAFILPNLLPAAADEGALFLDGVERWLELGRHARLVATKTSPDASLAPFVSDGCSGGLSAGWAFAARHLPQPAELHGAHPPWEACCVAHDRLYHAAPGADAEASFAARLAADEAMRLCVLAEGEQRKSSLMVDYGMSEGAVDLLYDGIAAAMYRAVRLGGVPCSRLAWRWGYGWPDCGWR